MTGLSDDVVRGIFQLACSFTCNIGNSEKKITGTGFFIREDRKLIFVTNKHNLDPRLKLGDDTTYRLSKISLCLRKETPLPDLSTETQWFDLENFEIGHSATADVSVIYNLVATTDMTGYQPVPFPLSVLADDSYLKNNVKMMDAASFVGFPGSKNVGWWDQEGHLPIARTVNIASYPKKDFVNPAVKTSDVMLVSGLSFSGSSGSPILLHQKGIRLSGTPGQISVKNPGFVEPKMIGIMSGHWWDVGSEPEMFKHSGLSYFTKSSVIIELINAMN